MKLDFHTHGKLAKRLPFSTAYTDWLFGEAKKAGLDAICLTEHFNTWQFDELYGYLLHTCHREGDRLLLANGLTVFPGMETDIREGGHILSLGKAEEILELNRRLEPYKIPGRFLPFEKLMDLFDEYDVLVGAAHPFRTGGHIPELPIEQLKRLDFLDLNGKKPRRKSQRYREKTYALGQKTVNLLLPAVIRIRLSNMAVSTQSLKRKVPPFRICTGRCKMEPIISLFRPRPLFKCKRRVS